MTVAGLGVNSNFPFEEEPKKRTYLWYNKVLPA